MDDLFDQVSADAVPVEEYAERAYLAYAISVVKGRALPELADGQKPVQRRILYAMREMRLGSQAKPVKSARVVGEVLGKFHPHGDNSAYDAMVRMAQDFSLRYPLIDGQGNFGSRDGDGAAAMRYTEARLTPIAELLLSELDAGTVDFVPNYDGAFDEPKLLPARLPFVLLNGAAGIAVGMATDIPPHNLREVAEAAIALIRKPELGLEELLTFIPAPDFPGGGQIISPPADIRAIYEGGRGSLRVRGRWQVEDQARGQKRIIITELPPNASTKSVMDDIERLTNPQPKPGKKAVGANEAALKTLVLSMVDAVRDEGDQQQPVRLVIEPKTSRVDPAAVMELLCAHTGLETSVPANLVMIGLDGRPCQKTLKDILSEWIDYRFQVVTRRTRHRLNEVEKRIHILEGRMIAFLNIDEVIRVIREADDPKADLMAAFQLSEIQAEDILEIRLRQLARLEGIKIERELASLREEQDGLQKLLASPELMKKKIIGEIRDDAKAHGDDRRTLVETVERAQPAAVAVDEPVTVILSRKGWIRSRSGHGVEAGNLSFKEGDALLAALETRTVYPVVVFDTTGRAYTLDAATLPGGRGDGVPVASLVDLAGPVTLAVSSPANIRYLFASIGGYGFISPLENAVSRFKAGKAFVSLAEGDQIFAALPVAEGEYLHVLTAKGRLLIYPVSEIKELPKGRGVMLLSLEEKDSILAMLSAPAGTVAARISRGGREQELVLEGERLEAYAGHRARKGTLLPPRSRPLGLIRIAKPEE